MIFFVSGTLVLHISYIHYRIFYRHGMKIKAPREWKNFIIVVTDIILYSGDKDDGFLVIALALYLANP